MDGLPSRKQKKNKGRFIRSVINIVGIAAIVFALALITSVVISFVQISERNDANTLKTIAQNIAILILTVTISFPSIYAAVYPTKYSEVLNNEIKRENLQEALFEFVLMYITFVFIFSLMYLSLSFLDKSKGISMLFGGLLGFIIIFLNKLYKLLKINN